MGRNTASTTSRFFAGGGKATEKSGKPILFYTGNRKICNQKGKQLNYKKAYDGIPSWNVKANELMKSSAAMSGVTKPPLLDTQNSEWASTLQNGQIMNKKSKNILDSKIKSFDEKEKHVVQKYFKETKETE